MYVYIYIYIYIYTSAAHDTGFLRPLVPPISPSALSQASLAPLTIGFDISN